MASSQKAPPKIAVIGTRGPCSAGGIATICQELYPHLSKDFDVTIYSRSPYVSKTVREYKGMRVVPIPTVPQKHLEATVHSFLSTLHAMASPANILHYHAQGPALFSWMPRIFTPWKKIVFSCHGIDWQRDKWGGIAAAMIRSGEWCSAHFSNAILVCAKNLGTHYKQTYGKTSHFFPNGVNDWPTAPAKHIQEKWRLLPQKYLLFMGRLVPEKAVHEIIQAYRGLSEEERQGVKLVIAGGGVGTDGYVDQLKQLAHGDEDIIFTGFVQGELRQELFSNAKCYVTASHLEGMPLTVLQALANGQPVILSDITPHLEFRQVISDANDAQRETQAFLRYYNTSDVQALKQNLLELIRLSPIQWQSIRENARQFVSKHYRWEHIAKQYATLYRNVLADS